jgi:hypothetical protein
MIKKVMSGNLPYTIGNVPVEHVILVARLKSFKQTSFILMELQDETGEISAIMYIGRQSKMIRPLADFTPREGEYVYCLAVLMKQSHAVDTITVEKLMNINDYQSVILHRIQVIWAHMVRNRDLHACTQNNPGVENLDSRFQEVEDWRKPAEQRKDLQNTEKIDDPNDELSKLKDPQRIIIQFFRTRPAGKAVNLHEILENCRMPKEEILRNLKELDEFGFIYVGHDQEVYYLS